MAEFADRDRRSNDDRRPGEKPDGARPDNGRPARGGPPASNRGPRPEADLSRNPREPRPGFDRPSSDRPSYPARGGAGRPASGRPGAGRPTTGRPTTGYQGRSPQEIEDRDPFGTQSVRSRHDDPIIPETVQAKDLDRVARSQLKTLSKENADEVARHLAMVASLIESDAPLAHLHATSAARRAGRIAVVRETLAITAYTVGDFALALRELRTYRRISGRDDQLPLMVDSERGLGRSDRALELGRSVARESLPVDVQVQLAIAMSGARLDLGQLDAALTELQIPQLDPAKAFSWSPDLFDAYAAVLEDLGRADEAEQWYDRAEIASAALDGQDLDDDVIEVVEEEFDDALYETAQALHDGAPTVVESAGAGDSADEPDAGNGKNVD